MKNKTFIPLFALSAISLIGCDQTDSAFQPKALRPIEVIELSEQQTHIEKHFSGVLKASETAALAFRVPGTIEQVLVKEGQLVLKGEVIARLDPHDYEVAVLELKARLSEAKAAHQLAKSEYARVKQATKDDAIAKVNLDRALSGYKRSAAMVKVVEQNLKRAQDSLRYTELKAPFDGVIAQTKAEQFEQAVPGISIFTLHQPNKLEAVIDVPENLVTVFSKEQLAQVSWYQSLENHSARLKEISTVPDVIKQTYRVVFQLDYLDSNASHYSVLPGKAVTVSVQFPQTNQAYCLPYSALIGEKGDQHVLLANQTHIESRPVRVTSLNTNMACIHGDFSMGDRVVVTGADYLTEGDRFGSLRFVTQ